MLAVHNTFQTHTGYVPEAGYLETLISQHPNFNDPDYVITPEDEAAFKGVAEHCSDLKPIPLQYVSNDVVVCFSHPHFLLLLVVPFGTCVAN